MSGLLTEFRGDVEFNISYYFLEAQINAGHGDNIALVQCSEYGFRQITYRELLLQVNICAKGLAVIGVR